MLTIFRFLRNFSKKEHEAFTRYGREHPHFLLFLGLDALLSVVLVGGGYAIITNNDPSKGEAHKLLEFGGALMTLEEVKLHAKTHGVTFYWVSDTGTKKFLADFDKPDCTTIIYIKDNPSIPKYSEQFLFVETYPDKERFDRALVGPVKTVPNIQSKNSRGDLVKFNRSDLTRAVIFLAHSSKIIVLKYSKPQEESKLISDSEKLVPLT